LLLLTCYVFYTTFRVVTSVAPAFLKLFTWSASISANFQIYSFVWCQVHKMINLKHLSSRLRDCLRRLISWLRRQNTDIKRFIISQTAYVKDTFSVFWHGICVKLLYCWFGNCFWIIWFIRYFSYKRLHSSPFIFTFQRKTVEANTKH
jgi:hypothetical protein